MAAKDYYENEVDLIKEQIIRLCYYTIPQSKCRLWFAERIKRITSTLALALYNAWKSTRLTAEERDEKILELFKGRSTEPNVSRKFKSAAMDYGNEYEDDARNKYCAKYEKTVVQLGMIVNVVNRTCFFVKLKMGQF